MKKVAFLTLGCKVNLYDTEAMQELFAARGYDIVDFENMADIYIINTCTVTNFGDKKSRQMIRRAKRQNPDAIVAATGCYAQVAPDTVSKIEGINIVVGTKHRARIVDIIEDYTDETKVLNAVSDIRHETEFEPLKISKLKDRTRAYVKIQEGCNRYCSYCIIPYARGPVRSRRPEEVVEEVKRLAQNGFKEVVLTGIHVASYGLDLKCTNLTDIVKQVNETEGIERIRFSSMEPTAVTEEFVAEMKKMPKICDHFPLSLQSGCDKTLKAMNRRYTADEYALAVDRLRGAFPDVAITTDIIVGFPGETEEDFLESIAFARRVGLSKIHVFPYSPKTGTPAAKMKEQVPPDVKNDRAARLIAVSDELNKKFIDTLKGRTMHVLFEIRNKDGYFEGHTTNYIKVLVKTEEDLKNKILNVKIGEYCGDETVYGEI
ncbi:MAG: tRNA (N(6)-L-threonylcarbamoyladenosine(37)-C(2))-methylthiotransferase MtaB [Firmicutes bacterium]|nr:tRNA (N(6)-L-threonylcarbamoyladenosine(37)-C(2))-methylthiotransferase MtaB [Bacillota bacterium]